MVEEFFHQNGTVGVFRDILIFLDFINKCNGYNKKCMEEIIKHKKIKIFIIFLFLITIIVNIIFIFNNNAAEFYATTIFPVIASMISSITGLFNFSVSEVLIYITPFLILFLIIRFIIRLFKFKTCRREFTKSFFLNLMTFLSVLGIFYYLLCGFNYNRKAFIDNTDFSVTDSTKEELFNMCNYYVDNLNEFTLKIKRENNLFVFSQSFDEMVNFSKWAIGSLSGKYPAIVGGLGKPKEIYSSEIMSHLFISGIYFPFTVESNFNKNIPPFDLPFTLCHELSHQKGIMRENEANFVAFLACKNTDNIDYKYSGFLNALSYSLTALHKEDENLYQKVVNRLDKTVIYDFNYSQDYWDKYKSKISEISTGINNIYLQSNNQSEGVKSYGKVVDLLIAEYNKTEHTL